MLRDLKTPVRSALLVGLLACSATSQQALALATAAEGVGAGTIEVDADPASVAATAHRRAASHGDQRACNLLSADTVSGVFGVPARQLMQIPIGGCRYSWNRPEETLEAVITLLQRHSDEDTARAWFEHATTGSNAAEAGSGDAPGFEAVALVGDAARMNSQGSLYVRAGKTTFVVSAYKGAKAPSLDVKGVPMRDVPKLAKQAAAQWRIETVAQRKKDAIALAKAIVARL